MNELQKVPQGSTHLSTERTDHRIWIKGRATTILSHYWREDDDPALLAAIGKDWADVLEGIPAEFIQRACVQYQRTEPRRRPTPGAIYEIARAMMPAPKPIEQRRTFTAQEQADYDDSVARDNINPERKAAAEAILRQAGINLKG
jgi:hypothetical protein